MSIIPRLFSLQRALVVPIPHCFGSKLVCFDVMDKSLPKELNSYAAYLPIPHPSYSRPAWTRSSAACST